MDLRMVIWLGGFFCFNRIISLGQIPRVSSPFPEGFLIQFLITQMKNYLILYIYL